jgi:hypothetical protein
MDLKDLKELLKVLRDKGVTEYECQGIKLKLSEDVPVSKYKRRQEIEEPMEPELTEEERLFYSAVHPMAPIEETAQ